MWLIGPVLKFQNIMTKILGQNFLKQVFSCEHHFYRTPSDDWFCKFKLLLKFKFIQWYSKIVDLFSVFTTDVA